jgi:hypothetical protein
MPIAMALSFLTIKVQVNDAVYQTINGEDKQVSFDSRNIDAAVDPSRSKALEMIFGGSLSDGDFGIFTHDTLHMVDQYEEGEQVKQSFVTYAGVKYRVAEVADWTAQAGVFVYLAKRHVKQDIV